MRDEEQANGKERMSGRERDGIEGKGIEREKDNYREKEGEKEWNE